MVDAFGLSLGGVIELELILAVSNAGVSRRLSFISDIVFLIVEESRGFEMASRRVWGNKSSVLKTMNSRNFV